MLTGLSLPADHGCLLDTLLGKQIDVWHSNQFRGRIAKKLCAGSIRRTQVALAADNEDQVAGRVHQPPVACFARGKGFFGALEHCEWSITAEASDDYNCIAYSVDITDAWVYQEGNPGPPHISIGRDYGDKDGVFDYPDDLDAFYAAKSYYPTASGPEDADVMYYSEFHAARKMGCDCGAGKWIMFESKCGVEERLEHVWNQLNGAVYGTPVRFYKYEP